MTTNERIEQFLNYLNKYINDELYKYLIENGFFTAPASVNHHSNYKGGLYDHSFTVMNSLLSLTRRLELKWQLERSPYIVGMFHDLCKIDNYNLVKDKLSKNKIIEHYEYKKSTILPGHGEKSVILLQQFLQLTSEEIACIRWHMGAFEGEQIYNNYGCAVTAYPNVLYTHTADMIATRILEV